MARALIIGFTCFIIAIIGLYWLSQTVEQFGRQNREITGPMPYDDDGPWAIGLLFFVILGFVALMVIAGMIAMLTSSLYWEKTGDIFLASALAGGTPIILLWIVFWCLVLANIIGEVFNHEPFGFSDLVFLAIVLVINLLTVGLGALIAGLSGGATCVLARGITRGHG
jgi:hypothetical protein